MNMQLVLHTKCFRCDLTTLEKSDKHTHGANNKSRAVPSIRRENICMIQTGVKYSFQEQSGCKLILHVQKSNVLDLNFWSGNSLLFTNATANKLFVN